jgi:hypothetical protein
VPTHDPERFIQLLRDHLAAHDKRLVFLFGAGTSSAVNVAPPPAKGTAPKHEPLIPAVALMTELCKTAVESVSPAHAVAWGLLEAECCALGEDPQIESMLGRLRLKVDAAGPTDTPLGLDQAQLAAFETKVRDTIAALASPLESTIPEAVPHEEFARWIRHARRRYPVEVFTTNYDILIERSLERMRIPLFDGFVGSYRPYFSPDAIESDATMPGPDWTRVWKLHGSTNWQLVDHMAVRLSATGAGDMILPSHRKYDESRKMPYLALMDRFARCLSADGSLLVTCGYSWSDEHVNATILTAMDNHPANGVVALLYPELDEVPQLVALAERRDNLMVIAPREGILRGKRHQWALPSDITRATASFLDISFDSDAMPEGSNGSVTGRMRLGDFTFFCNFLAAMNPETNR